jgi:hypothetical protein
MRSFPWILSQLLPPPPALTSPDLRKMKVVVKNAQGTAFDIELQACSTVHDVKSSLSRLNELYAGCAPDVLSLVYRGKTLRDDEALNGSVCYSEHDCMFVTRVKDWTDLDDRQFLKKIQEKVMMYAECIACHPNTPPPLLLVLSAEHRHYPFYRPVVLEQQALHHRPYLRMHGHRVSIPRFRESPC